MKTRYQVTDSRGQVHTRRTERTYTHVVVVHIPGRPADGPFLAREAYSKASWCGRLDLARKTAQEWTHSGRISEIIEV